jgi:hypothetical protein
MRFLSSRRLRALLICNAGTEFRFVGYLTQVPKYLAQAGAGRPFGDHPVSLLTCELAPGAANKTLKSIKTFLRWCVGRAVLDRGRIYETAAAPSSCAGSGRCTPPAGRRSSHLEPSGDAGEGRVRSKLEAVEAWPKLEEIDARSRRKEPPSGGGHRVRRLQIDHGRLCTPAKRTRTDQMALHRKSSAAPSDNCRRTRWGSDLAGPCSHLARDELIREALRILPLAPPIFAPTFVHRTFPFDLNIEAGTEVPRGGSSANPPPPPASPQEPAGF